MIRIMNSTLKSIKLNPYLFVFVFGMLLFGLVSAIFPFLILLPLGIILIYQILKRPILMIYGLAFFFAFQIEMDLPWLGGATLSSPTIGAISLIILIVLAALTSRPWLGRLVHTPELGILIIFLGFSSAAIATGPNISGIAQGLWAIFRIVWVGPIFFLFVWMFVRNPRQIRWLLVCISGGATIGSAIAIIQTATSGRLLSGLLTNYRYLGFLLPLPADLVSDYSNELTVKLFLGNTNIYRGHGTFFASNVFGVFLSTVIFITWGLYRSASRKTRPLWLITLIIQVFGVLSTFSRSAWAAIVGVIALLILWNFRGALHSKAAIRTIFFLTGVLVLAAIGASFFFPNVIDHFTTILNPSNVPELTWRFLVWDYTKQQIFRDPLLGVGTSTIDNSVAQIPGSGPLTKFSSHNLLIDIAYQRGLLVLVCFMILTLNFFWKLIKTIKLQKRLGKTTDLSLALLAAGAAFFISGMGSASMTTENLATLLWSLFGLSLSLFVYTKKYAKKNNTDGN